MDPSLKKRKADENGNGVGGTETSPNPNLTPEDLRKVLESFTQDQLLDILQHAALRHLDVLDGVRSIADRDPSQRKLFIRGLGWDTTTERLRNLFSSYGELAEAVVILDKVTGKSKGYGFVTFKHIDGALLALKDPSKEIDGRMTVTQLAATGSSGPPSNATASDVSMRKIYVGNVPVDMPADRLLAHFSSYGEIEEGPLGFDKQTGKSRGFALFVYKTAEAARASLVDSTKVIDGHQMVCKLAIEGKKGKPGMPPPAGGGVGGPTGFPAAVNEAAGDGSGMPPSSSMPPAMSSHYGAPPSSYGGFSGGHQGPQPIGHHHMGSALQSSMGSQVPSAGLGGAGAAGGHPSMGGGGGGYGMGGSYGGGLSGGPTSGGYGGSGSSLYNRMPPSSHGVPSGGYPESGHYGLSSSSFPSQGHQPSGTSPVPRVPAAGGMYPGMPPYY